MTCVLALLFAGLMGMFDWEQEEALMAETGGSLAASVLLLAMLLLLARKKNRPELWQIFLTMMTEDWEKVLRFLSIKR